MSFTSSNGDHQLAASRACKCRSRTSPLQEFEWLGGSLLLPNESRSQSAVAACLSRGRRIAGSRRRRSSRRCPVRSPDGDARAVQLTVHGVRKWQPGRHNPVSSPRRCRCNCARPARRSGAIHAYRQQHFGVESTLSGSRYHLPSRDSPTRAKRCDPLSSTGAAMCEERRRRIAVLISYDTRDAYRASL